MSLIESITVENLDHLGIVAGLIDEIGIVELINQKKVLLPLESFLLVVLT